MDALGATVIASDMGDLLGAMSQFRFADERITHSIATERLFHVDGTPREDFVADQSLPSADTDAAGGDPALRTAIELLSAPD
jgi:carboxyl-terminal processing protease